VRILLLADGLEGSSLSEPALWLSELCERWVARGHSVQVITVNTPEPWQEPEDPPGVSVLRPGREGFEAALGEALALEPDVVHIATSGPLGARVVEILRELPVLLDVHDFWPICPNHDLLRRPRFEACGEHYPYPGCGSCAGLSRMRAMEEKVELAATAKIVLAHSAFTRVRLNAGLGRPIEMIDYGIDTTRFRPDPTPPTSALVSELYSTRDRPRALLLGPPTMARGAARLLDLLVAVRIRVPDVEFVVAGRDPENPDWHQVFLAEAREMGLSQRAFAVPDVPRADLPALYASCQVGMAPISGHEPGGLFVLQALACGMPVVASPMGAMQDLFQQGSEGLMVSAKDMPSFALGISTLLIDPMARMAFGESARLRAVERHDFERTVYALEEMYHRLREGPRHRVAA
jgi:glycosyltransferase involved in cell wall biosynthesis